MKGKKERKKEGRKNRCPQPAETSGPKVVVKNLNYGARENEFKSTSSTS